MIFKNFNIFLIIVTFTVSASCQSDQLPDELNMTAAELKSAMESDSNLVILDVRTPQELTGKLGKIEGVINIPVQELSEKIDELDQYKGTDIAVICRSGNRSVFATKLLSNKGFSAKNVLGGMIAFNNL